MKKRLLLGIVSSCLVINAQADDWTSGMGQGWQEYSLIKQNDDAIQISCNVDYDERTDHKITILLGSKEYEVNEKSNISFSITGKRYYPLSMPTSTRNGGNEWLNFIKAINTTKPIDIYMNKKKLATFNPKSVGNVDCPPLD